MKYLFFLAAHKRYDITLMCYRGLHRVIEYTKKTLPDASVDVFVVCSDQRHIELATAHGFYTSSIIPNEPLGAKMNKGLRQAKELQFDYLIQSGTDNLYTSSMLVNYDRYAKKGLQLFGQTSIYFYDTMGNRVKVYHGTNVFGAGRAISRKVVDGLEKLWPDEINKGLDNASEKRIEDKFGFKNVRAVPINYSKTPIVIDLKSMTNIHNFEDVPGESLDCYGFTIDILKAKFPEL